MPTPTAPEDFAFPGHQRHKIAQRAIDAAIGQIVRKQFAARHAQGANPVPGAAKAHLRALQRRARERLGKGVAPNGLRRAGAAVSAPRPGRSVAWQSRSGCGAGSARRAETMYSPRRVFSTEEPSANAVRPRGAGAQRRQGADALQFAPSPRRARQRTAQNRLGRRGGKAARRPRPADRRGIAPSVPSPRAEKSLSTACVSAKRHSASVAPG